MGSGPGLEEPVEGGSLVEVHVGVVELHEHAVAYRSNYIPEIDMTQLFFSDPAGTGLEVNFPGERVW